MNNLTIHNLKQAQAFLFNYIPIGAFYKYPGQRGLDRQKKLLDLLGTPQNKLKIVHIAGTSGKGSTAYLTSKILTDQGFKTGLTVSPHLLDIRERAQINNQLLLESTYCRYLEEIIPVIQDVTKLEMGEPTYFEITTALAYYIFFKEKVDYAIIETGLGGWRDGTNVVDRSDKVSIITRIGHDHIKILGKTLPEIAWQKAMIINNQSQAITIFQNKSINNVFESVAKEKHTTLHYITPSINYSKIKESENGIVFNYNFMDLNLPEIESSLHGSFQAENSSLAIATTKLLSLRDSFAINTQALRQTFKSAYFPGRFDIKIINSHKIVLDGAHNLQKISSLCKSLTNLFPNQKFIFLLAFKYDKDVEKMIQKIVPLAQQIIFTTFTDQKETQGYASLSYSVDKIKKIVHKYNLTDYQIISDPENAFKAALSIANKKITIVSGSLYLMTVIYKILLKQNAL